MKYTPNGASFSVAYTESDVEDFAAKWPCFGPCRALIFMFDRRSGDLVDIFGNTNGMDGHGVLCLSQDAQVWGNAQGDTS